MRDRDEAVLERQQAWLDGIESCCQVPLHSADWFSVGTRGLGGSAEPSSRVAFDHYANAAIVWRQRLGADRADGCQGSGAWRAGAAVGHVWPGMML
jgi:hypothetical protein